MPQRMKDYYLEHLESFGRIFYQAPRDWLDLQNPDYYYRQDEDYSRDDELCQRLHDLAPYVVIAQKDINDRSWIHHQIGWIDSSNVGEYVPVLALPETRMIFTRGTNVSPYSSRKFYKTDYYSYLESSPLTPEEIQEFNDYILRFRDHFPKSNTSLILRLQTLGNNPFRTDTTSMLRTDDPLNTPEDSSRSRATLIRLRRHFQQYVYSIPRSFWEIFLMKELDIMNFYDLRTLSMINPDLLQQLFQEEKTTWIQRFLPILLTNLSTGTDGINFQFIHFCLGLLERPEATEIVRSWIAQASAQQKDQFIKQMNEYGGERWSRLLASCYA
jgi:hypothetical protein